MRAIRDPERGAAALQAFDGGSTRRAARAEQDDVRAGELASERFANRAGEVSYRKAAAARAAERVLNANLIMNSVQGLSQTGVAQEGAQQYRWTIRSQPWTQDSMLLLTAEVLFAVQGRDYDVHLSTLVSNAASQ